MRTADRLPIAPDTVTTQDAILAMTRAKSGSIALVHPKSGKLTGILTDGDFRRSALTGPDFLRQPVANFMTRTPKTVREDALGVDALRLFEAHKIDDLIVITRLLTIFDTYDSVEEAVGEASPAYAGVQSPRLPLLSLGTIHRILRGV